MNIAQAFQTSSCVTDFAAKASDGWSWQVMARLNTFIRERIMHQVALRSRPQGCRVPAQIFRHLFGRNHRAIGGVAGQRAARRRRPSAAGFLSASVGADQAEPVMRSPVFNRTVTEPRTGRKPVTSQSARSVIASCPDTR